MEQFDPYHRWLGIPPDEQPANHYRLLGLVPFESDPEVIRDAAERQMGHVRRYGLGKHSELSQKVLNALGGAKACLLNPAQKSHYDAHLKQELAAKAAAEAPPPVPLDAAPAPLPPPPPPPQRQKRKAPLLIGGVVCGLLVALSGGVWLFQRGAKSETARPLLKIESIGHQVVEVGSSLVLRARVTNAEAWAGKLEYRFSENEPDGATINTQTGEIRWKPETPGLVSVVIGVLSPDSQQYDDTSFTVEVRPETPKLLPIADQEVDQGATLQFTAKVSNAGRAGEMLTYRLAPGVPRGAQIDPQSGVFTWTPDKDPGAGEYQLAVQVVSPAKLSDQTRVCIRVRAINHPPELQVPDTARVVSGTQQRVEIKAYDPDQPGDRLTFSLLDAETGVLSCAPSALEVGRSHRLRIRVTDNAAQPLADEKTITLLVEKGPDALTPQQGFGMLSTPATEAAPVRLELSSGKIITLTQWDLGSAARTRAAELHQQRLAETPGSYIRFASGPGTPIVDLCGFKRGREVNLEGAVIGLQDGVSYENFFGRTLLRSSTGRTLRPSSSQLDPTFSPRGVNWEQVRFRSYRNADNGRWQGALATWDSQGRREYYGEYVKGRREGYCCVFQADAPRLIMECAAGKMQLGYLIAQRQVEKQFADEAAARNDEQAAGLLEQARRIEAELHKHDELIEKAIEKEFNLLQGQITAKARENMRNRSADRENERQSTMNAIKKAASGAR